jgi:hypothetical protein
MKLYAVEFEVLHGPKLLEQTTAHVHASSPDEAVAYVRSKHAGKPMRFVRIERDSEPDNDQADHAHPLEPLPTCGARIG